MIIDIIPQTYQPGVTGQMALFKRRNVLLHLNGIIEWEFSSFPQDRVELEGQVIDIKTDDKYLGEKPELKPGNIFYYSGQCMAVHDPHTIALLLSETGGNALERIWDEGICLELDLKFNDYEDTEIDLHVDFVSGIPGNYVTAPVPYALYKLWRDRFLPGRGVDLETQTVKIEMDSSSLVMPCVFFMRKWGIAYNPDIIVAGQMQYLANEIISWFYKNTDRLEYENKAKLELGTGDPNSLP